MKLHAHLLDQLELLADQVVGQRRRQPGVVLVAVRAAQQQPLAVELETARASRTRTSAGRSARSPAARRARSCSVTVQLIERRRRRATRAPASATAKAASSCAPVHGASDLDGGVHDLARRDR